MNKYRFVPTSIWSDETFHNMMPHEKLFTLFLLTSSRTSMCGVWVLNLPDLAHFTGYHQGPIKTGWETYLRNYSELVAYDPNTKEVALLTWPKINLINANKRALSAASRDLENVQSIELLKLIIKANSSTLSKMYLEQLRRLQITRINEKKQLEMLDSEIHGDSTQLPEKEEVESKVKFKPKVKYKDKEEIRDESRTYPDDIAEKIAEKGISEYLLNDAVEKALAIIAAEKNDPPPVAAAPSLDFPESDEDLNPIDSFSFQDFWDAYGMKLDRAKCEAKWGKLKKSEIEEIERTLPYYISDTVRDDSEQEKGVWRRRRKNPLTYLNGKTWRDYADATGPMVKKEARIRDIKRTNATQIIDDKKYDKWRNKAQVT